MKGATWQEVLEELRWEDLENVSIDGVDSRDYPDFCDAFIDGACYQGITLCEEDCDYLTSKFPQEVMEMAYESLIR